MVSMIAIKKYIILILVGLTMLGCKPIVNKLAFHPDNVNIIPANNLPDGIREVTINTEDKVKITSLYLLSAESDKILIYFHGNAGNIYHRIPDLLQLQGLGVNVIGVSYRGYGKSSGKPTEDGIYMDGEAIFRYVVNQMGFSKENIIIFGRSIGTSVAINIAQNKRIRGVILVSPLTSGKEQAKAGGLGLLSLLAGDSFNNIEKVVNIKSPLLVIHGSNDRIIPCSMGRKIFYKAKVKKEFVEIEGADHNNLSDLPFKDYWLSISRFIKNVPDYQ